MVDNLQHLVGEGLESVFFLECRLDLFFGIAVSAQVQQQNIILLLEIPNLLEPNRRTAASSVDKSHPLLAVFVFV